VFGWSERVAALPEGQSPQHPGQQVGDAVFLGAAVQIPNLHRLEAECRGGVLAQRIGALSQDTRGYALQRQDPAGVLALGCEGARRLKRNGVLRAEWGRGRLVAAVDGIEICRSFSRCGDACRERAVEHQVDGQRRKDTQYYHRIVAVVLVRMPFPLPLGIRFQKDGETEVAGAIALLPELDQHLGRRFLDLVVGDALYLQQGFVNAGESLDLEWVFNLKENQPELLAEAQRLTQGPAETTLSNPQEDVQLWHAPEVDGPLANRSLRVVKTFRLQKVHRVQVIREESGKKQKTRQAVPQASTNFCATPWSWA
jgi:hypothetical protein